MSGLELEEIYLDDLCDVGDVHTARMLNRNRNLDPCRVCYAQQPLEDKLGMGTNCPWYPCDPLLAVNTARRQKKSLKWIS
jgi:hypothetical protein